MDRNNIEELITKYTLEPSVKDIYLEGDTDKNCLNIYIERMEFKNHAGIFNVDLVEMPKDYLLEKNIVENNRGRLIALEEILRKNIDNFNSAIFIIDRDFDDFLGINLENQLLYYTDFSCMEMIFFNKKILNRFIKFNFRSFPIQVGELLINLIDILVKLFLIRFANYKLRLYLQEYCFLKVCNLNRDDKSIIFNCNVYLERYLHKNNKHGELKKINKIIKQYLEIKQDYRFRIHGLDLVRILVWYFYKIKKIKLEESILKTNFYLCLNKRDFQSYNLFKKVKEFIGE